MLKKVLKEIILFIFSIGLIVYVLVFCCFDFLIGIFIGTNITTLLLYMQKNMDIIIEKVGSYIIEKLENKNLWY